MAELETAWNWTAASRSAPDHLHARHEAGEFVVIITGSTGGALPSRKAGARLPRAAALELARFILGGET